MKTKLEMLIEKKENELNEAINNAEWHSSIGLDDWANGEVEKQKKLITEIDKLKSLL